MRMFPQPFANFFDTLIIFLAKLFGIYPFHVAFGFLRMETILPWTSEEFIQIVMQISFDQYIPLMFIKPDPVAISTTIKEQICIWDHFIAFHDVSTVWAKFQNIGVPLRVNLRGDFLFGQVLTLRTFPKQVGIRRNKNALAVRTLLSREIFNKRNRIKCLSLANGTFHNKSPSIIGILQLAFALSGAKPPKEQIIYK